MPRRARVGVCRAGRHRYQAADSRMPSWKLTVVRNSGTSRLSLEQSKSAL